RRAVRDPPGRVRRPSRRARGRQAAGLPAGAGRDRHGGGHRLRARARRPRDSQLPGRRRSSAVAPALPAPRPAHSGGGPAAIGRQVDRSGFQLTIDAILAAVADAGLTIGDIDGLAMFPGGGAANLPGYANGNLYEVQDALRISTTWRQGIVEGMPLPCYGPA